MPLYSNAIRDERVRDYLPVRRVMLAERVEKADILPGNTACQVSLSGLEKCCVLKHGASLLVDFGIELRLETSPRNTLGPFHTNETEPLSTSPGSFLTERDLLGWYAATDVPEYGVLEPSPEEITLS